MPRGYSYKVRAEAITRRYQGREWKEIQSAIEEKFSLKPSIRQMQKWFEDYQSSTDDPTAVRYVAKMIEDAANMARPLAQARMMADVIPLWSQLQEQYNKSPVDAGWIAFLSFFEDQIGHENFDRILKDYLKLRDKLGQPPTS